MKQDHKCIYDIIRYHSERNEDIPAAVGTDLDVSFSQLVKDIDLVSHYIVSQGLQQDASVSIIMPPNYIHMVFILALDRLGIVSNSYTFPADTLMGQEWWNEIDFNCIFSTEIKPSIYKGKWITLNKFPETSIYQNAEALPIDHKPDRVVRITCSSGTTGLPKAIHLNRENVMKRITALIYYEPEFANDKHFVGMPLDTAGGYGVMLSALAHGCALVVWRSDENFLDLMLKYKPTHMLLTPLTLRNIAIYGFEHNIKLGFAKWVCSGGMIFDVRLKDSLQAVFGNTVINGYGSTEAWAVAGSWVHKHDYTPYIIGHAVNGAQIQIVDENDREVLCGETGIVRVKTDFMIDGYVDGDNDSNFRDGFFYSGDLGSLDEQESLRILGRADDLVNIGGQKILPNPIEEELTNLSEIKEAAVFQASTKKGFRVCGALVLSDTEEQSPENHGVVIDRVKNSLGRLCPDRIFFVSELPRNGMGKVMRHALAQSLVKLND